MFWLLVLVKFLQKALHIVEQRAVVFDAWQFKVDDERQ